MKVGSAITSRESHDVRHMAAERQARSGRPRWKKEATRPSDMRITETAQPCTRKAVGGTGPTPMLEAASTAKSARKRPWPAPMSVVRKTTEKAGRIQELVSDTIFRGR